MSLLTALQKPAYLLAAAIALLCMALHYGGYSDALRFDRQAIDAGEYWRLLSAHAVHLGSSHLWLNLAGLALVVALVWPRYSGLEWLLITVASSGAIGLALYWLNPSLYWYVGFSGTLHALLIAGTLADLRVYPRSAAALLVLLIAKLTWEQVLGPLPGSESASGGRVEVDAHLYGAIAGALIGGLLMVRQRWRESRQASSTAPPAHTTAHAQADSAAGASTGDNQTPP